MPELTAEQQHLIRQIIAENPVTQPFLNWKNGYELLVAVVLSAQCTDAMVNKVTPALFAACPTPEALAAAPLEQLERLVHSTGFYRDKARNLKAAGQLLTERHRGQIPESMEDLTALPGVGRKTANVLRGTLFGLPAIIVDTHFKRVVRRLGLTAADEPAAIERELAALLPAAYQYPFSMSANLHGRRVCKARTPDCENCPVHWGCPASSV